MAVCSECGGRTAEEEFAAARLDWRGTRVFWDVFVFCCVILRFPIFAFSVQDHGPNPNVEVLIHTMYIYVSIIYLCVYMYNTCIQNYTNIEYLSIFVWVQAFRQNAGAHLGKHLCAKESFGGGRLSKEQRPKEADERAVVNMEESTGRALGKGAQIRSTNTHFDQFFFASRHRIAWRFDPKVNVWHFLKAWDGSILAKVMRFRSFPSMRACDMMIHDDTWCISPSRRFPGAHLQRSSGWARGGLLGMATTAWPARNGHSPRCPSHLHLGPRDCLEFWQVSFMSLQEYVLGAEWDSRAVLDLNQEPVGRRHSLVAMVSFHMASWARPQNGTRIGILGLEFCSQWKLEITQKMWLAWKTRSWQTRTSWRQLFSMRQRSLDCIDSAQWSHMYLQSENLQACWHCVSPFLLMSCG